MTIALWIVQVLLGVLFIITGCFKFFQNKEKIIASGGSWAEDFTPATIKIISAGELISGLLVVVSKFLSNAHYLTFIGAGCIALIMTGSIYTHISRKEFQHAGINSVFLIMAVFVIYASRAL